MRSGDVDARFRQYFRLGFQVQSWNGLLRSYSGSGDNPAFQRVRAAEHAAGDRNLTGFDGLPNLTRRDNPAAPDDGLEDLLGKAIFPSQPLKRSSIAAV